MSFPTPIISASDLRERVSSGECVRIVDCSFDLNDPDAGQRQYGEAHLPGALYAHLERDLSAHPPRPVASGGRHPLPERSSFAQWLGHSGITPDMPVVVYDRQGQNFCGRLWWMLRWLGHQPVAMLDGGLAAWREAGGSLDSGQPARPAAAPYDPGPPLERLVRCEEVLAALDGDQTLLDARAPARFRGEVEPLDPVAGHIPGARNRPFAENFGPDGRFKPADQLRREFQALLGGRDPATVVHHCGSGVSAVPNLVAMALAGLPGSALFAGSWSEWCRDPCRPVARG